jgi:hypothetical protein
LISIDDKKQRIIVVCAGEVVMSIRKALLSGLVSFILFTVLIMFFGVPIGTMIMAGDKFILSYHMFSYVGLATLCGLMVTLFCFILYRIDILEEEIKKSKTGGEN